MQPSPLRDILVVDEASDQIAFRTTAGQVVAVEPSLQHGVPGAHGGARHVGVARGEALDFSVVRFERPVTAAAVYTRSLTASPAVHFSRRATERGQAQLVVVISKNANVFAPDAEADLERIADAAAREFAVDRSHIVIGCTGVIGVPLPLGRVLDGMRGLATTLSAPGMEDVSRAILTTDKGPKCASTRVGDLVVSGYAKGAGMIEPNLATMLVYLYTNARVEKPVLDAVLKRAVDRTFNALSIDSDTSTSDTVSLFATGECPVDSGSPGAPCLDDLERALTAVCFRLCRRIAREAEGATKLLQVTVRLGTSTDDALFFAKKVLNSPLVKAAVHGGDPNWGRIVMALGKPLPGSPVLSLDRARISIRILDRLVYDRGRTLSHAAGQSTPSAEDHAAEYARLLSELRAQIRQAATVSIDITIGAPVYERTVWGCDLSPEYVHENSSYTS